MMTPAAIPATKPKAIFFDLDGTLIDTALDFINAVQHLCLAHSVQAPSDLSIRNTVSDGARALVSLSLGGKEGDANFEEHRQQLLALYNQQLGLASQFFDGIVQVIDRIDNNKQSWGIVTNKPRLYAEPLLKVIRPRIDTRILICPEDVTHAKPHPEPLLMAATQAGVAPEHCIYIGDHDRDIQSGRAAGMRTIAAAYGYVDSRKEAEAWQADHTIDHASEILAIIS